MSGQTTYPGSVTDVRQNRWGIVNNTTANSVTVLADAIAKAAFSKRHIKTKIMIFDAVKDHVILHISSKDHAHQMWTALTNLYQSSNENRKMVLREKLKSIRMNKGENMTTYLTRITRVHDELGAIGEVIECRVGVYKLEWCDEAMGCICGVSGC